ncbi:MAG TPA: hypothetical protein VMZ28_08645 [Kofleriaceae bacterium]|nr:hypothetical protein [Kofleriaceae bacterium]
MMTRVLLGLGLVSMFAACGGGDDDGGGSVTCAEVAAIIGDCGGELTEADFMESCETYRYPDGCLEAVAGAECAEHDEDDPSYFDTCFPSCNADDPPVCNDDDSITVCDPDLGSQFTFYCAAICEQVVMSPYTGTCGTTYMDMTSESGDPTCWCE